MSIRSFLPILKSGCLFCYWGYGDLFSVLDTSPLSDTRFTNIFSIHYAAFLTCFSFAVKKPFSFM